MGWGGYGEAINEAKPHSWILGHQFACVKWRKSSFSKPSNQSFSLNKRPEVQKKETPGKRKERDS